MIVMERIVIMKLSALGGSNMQEDVANLIKKNIEADYLMILHFL